MAQVSVAATTKHLGSLHAVGKIVLERDIGRSDRSKKTGPAGVALKLGFRMKEGLSAADAEKKTVVNETVETT